MLKVIKSIPQMLQFIARSKQKCKNIGFVPTMGYLHEGHISLVRKAVKDNDIAVVSIFVNPTQFGPKEDLNKYPQDLKRDISLLKKEGVDIVFIPSRKEMYPEGFNTYLYVNELSDFLCGKSRPGHFKGVATVVLKLFNIVRPDRAYFGRKDYQQQMIIKQMVKDLDLNVQVIDMPTVRESNGLAMSSRNSYLDGSERSNAAVISRALSFAKDLAFSGVKDVEKIKSAVKKIIRTVKNVKIDYVSICDPETFKEVKKIKNNTLVAVAVFFGKTRLIDNIIVR